MLLDIISN